ncbi:MAG: hypothetical protein AB7H97_11210 [Pseudobdellovibrionaceae bacterium]
MNEYAWHKEPIVCWISELPPSLPANQNGACIIQPNNSQHKSALGTHGAFIISEGIEVRTSEQHADLRIFAVVLESKLFGFNKLGVIGVHLLDARSQPDPAIRHADAQDYMGTLRHNWVGAWYEKQVILGDFNMEPTDRVMSLHQTFFSSDDYFAVTNSRKVIHNHKEYMRFFNAAHANITLLNPKGTFLFRGAPSPWKLIDQVLLSPKLADHYETNSVRVIDNLNKTPLLKSSSSLVTPMVDDGRFGDHLPIELKVRYHADFLETTP